jgi:hypothetical protein
MPANAKLAAEAMFRTSEHGHSCPRVRDLAAEADKNVRTPTGVFQACKIQARNPY